MIYAVILAGGKGERLWPMTRKNRPKYLLKLAPLEVPATGGAVASGDLPLTGSVSRARSLLEQTIDRIKPITKNILIVTTKQQRRFLFKEKLSGFVRYVIEPRGLNTANAIRLAARRIAMDDPDGLMVILPADHLIRAQNRFLKTLKSAISFVETHSDVLMTIGIEPSYPATGYGYIKINPKSEIRNPKFYRVERFVEKPDKNTAEKFVRSGNYLWNGGMFVWKAKTILNAIEKYIPNLDPVSIDYGVMEKAKDVYVAKGDFEWLDVGSWKALEAQSSNAVLARHIGLDTENCIIAGDKKHLIGTIGLSGLVVVHTDDATLICPKDRAEDVRTLVEKIRKRGLKRFL